MRTYGQYCGLAHALDLVGERWGLLVIRDLLTGPKRFTDLRRGLPGIPSNVLTTRLKEMEEAGVVARRVLPRPSGAVVYDVTDYGRELDAILLPLARWGVRSIGPPREGDVVTPSAFIFGLRASFRPQDGLQATFELRVQDVVVWARVDGASLEVGEGPAEAPDLVIETGLELRDFMEGDDAARETMRLTGDPALLDRFAESFRF